MRWASEGMKEANFSVAGVMRKMWLAEKILVGGGVLY